MNEVLHVDVLAAALLRELHQGADELLGRDDLHAHIRLREPLALGRLRQLGGVGEEKLLALDWLDLGHRPARRSVNRGRRGPPLHDNVQQNSGPDTGREIGRCYTSKEVLLPGKCYFSVKEVLTFRQGNVTT